MNVTTTIARQWRGIFFDGPQPDQNHDGDEIPIWLVYVGDEDAHPNTPTGASSSSSALNCRATGAK